MSPEKHMRLSARILSHSVQEKTITKQQMQENFIFCKHLQLHKNTTLLSLFPSENLQEYKNQNNHVLQFLAKTQLNYHLRP